MRLNKPELNTKYSADTAPRPRNSAPESPARPPARPPHTHPLDRSPQCCFHIPQR